MFERKTRINMYERREDHESLESMQIGVVETCYYFL